jgi:hypothetical protein
VPARDGNEPVAPAKFPVPPVTVADPVPEPLSIVAGTVRVPVIVPVVPLVKVIVYGAVNVVRLKVAVNVPLPMFVKVAVPLTATPVAPIEPVPFTVNVVFVVAA